VATAQTCDKTQKQQKALPFGGRMRLATSKTSLFATLLVVILLLTVFFLSSCGSKNPGLTSAKIYLGLTPPDYEKATEQLQIALKQEPDNAEAHFLLGKIYAEKGEYELMHQEFQKAKAGKLTEKNSEELQLITAQKWTEVLNSGISLGKKRKQVDKYKLDLLTDFSRYPQYKDSLKTISSGLEKADRFSWDSYQMFSDTKPALEDLERTLRNEAVAHYRLAILLDSTRYEAYLNLAAEYVHKDDLDTALGYYEKAYKLKPDDSNVMNDYAITLLSSNRYDEALGLYERILEKDPSNVNALVNLAMIHARKGETEKSLDTYSRIISIDPEYKDAYFNRGLLFLTKAQGKMSLLKSYKDSVEENPKDRELSSRYQSTQEEYDQLFAKAGSDFRKTTEIDPNDKDAFFHLGLLYVSRAQIRKTEENQNQDFVWSEEYFRKSLELDPQDVESMKYLGFALLSQKKWKDAASLLEGLVEIDPTDREAWGYLAIAYANLGKRDKAEDALKKSAR
jgi:Tfp pilus assembly protein PilF